MVTSGRCFTTCAPKCSLYLDTNWPAAIMAGMFCCVWLALAAHHGGQLVYAHGVGVGTVPDRPVVDQTRQEAAPGIQVIEEGENP